MGDGEAEKQRWQPVGEYCDEGRMREVMYADLGDMKMEERDERREVHCLRESLSEHDMERLGGASPRLGLRRTMASWEKNALPGRDVGAEGWSC